MPAPSPLRAGWASSATPWGPRPGLYDPRVPRGVRRPADARLRDAQAWTAARAAGDSVAEIARASGASPATVSRATSGHGPFPRLGQPPGAAAAAGWAQRRREGEPVPQISRLAGVSTTSVYTATKAFGPFPTTRAAAAATNESRAPEWAALRQSGASLAAIARQYAVTAPTISRVTRPLGPFPAPSPAGPGTISLRGISRLSGLTMPALRRRADQGELPPPAGHPHGGWPYWRVDDIRHWLEASTLDPCPHCGTRLKRLDWHLISRHADTLGRRHLTADGRRKANARPGLLGK